MSFFTLEHDQIVDHAGTPESRSLITSDRELLITELERVLWSGAFAEDSLYTAWTFSIVRKENRLAAFNSPLLTVFQPTGGIQQLDLIPNARISRGKAVMQMTIDITASRFTLLDALDPDDVETSYNSLEELGADESRLAPLRAEHGEVEIELDTAAVRLAIPLLSQPLLRGSLYFTPFAKAQFREFLAVEADQRLLEKLPNQKSWDGWVPCDQWFPVWELLDQCDAAGFGDHRWKPESAQWQPCAPR